MWEGPEVRKESTEDLAVILRRLDPIPRQWGAMEGFRGTVWPLCGEGTTGAKPGGRSELRS